MKETELNKENIERNEAEPYIEIWSYLKEHPTVWISVFSALVLIISFVFNILIYVNECYYLEYWEIDTKFLIIKNEDKIFDFVALGLLFVALMFIFLLLTATFDKYYEDMKICVYGNILIKSTKKNNRKKKVKTKKNIILNDKKDGDSEALNRVITKVRNTGRIVRKNTWPKMFLTFLATTIFFSAIMWIYSEMNGREGEWTTYFGICIVTILMMWLGSRFVSFHSSGGFSKKQYKELELTQKNAKYKQLVNEYSQKKVKYPIEKIIDMEISRTISKRKIFVICLYLPLFLAAFFSMINFSERKDIKECATFAVYEQDSVDYVLIYRDETYFYLEEAELRDREIVIHVEKQRRLIAEDLVTTNHTFDKVTRVKENGEVLK